MKGRIIGLDHVGLASKNPQERVKVWCDRLGLPLVRTEVVETEGVRTWFLDLGDGSKIELLEPLGEEGPIARHLQRRGEGVHHICLAVTDLEGMLASLASGGIEAIGGIREGAEQKRIAFLHPRDTGGVLLELAESVGDTKATRGPHPGELVVLYLRDPRERVVGVIESLDHAGVTIDGLDHAAWNDWIAQWARGEPGPLAPSLQYFPMARVERILFDRESPDMPSMAREFSERTGRGIGDALRGYVERE